MARKNEAEKLLRQSLTPSQIGRRMGISVASVIQYLRTRVGEGALHLSDIYFSIPEEKWEVLKQANEKKKSGGVLDISFLKAHDLTPEEFELYQHIHSRHVFAGDLYEHVSETEIAVHDLVMNTLKEEYGDGEEGYWRKGVPESIRKKCQSKREEDDQPCDVPFKYTELLDLPEIIGKHWSIFQRKLPKEYASDKSALTRDLRRLNEIRKTVMHPVKRRRWSANDFQFASKLRAVFQKFRAP